MRPKVTIEYDIVTLCPFDKSIDQNHITVTYRPTATNFIEFIEFHNFLETFRMKEIMHEDLADQIYQKIKHFDPIVQVSSEFPTLRGMRVTITQGGNIDV